MKRKWRKPDASKSKNDQTRTSGTSAEIDPETERRCGCDRPRRLFRRQVARSETPDPQENGKERLVFRIIPKDNVRWLLGYFRLCGIDKAKQAWHPIMWSINRSDRPGRTALHMNR